MTSRILKILATLAITSLVASCKLLVVSPPGGNITSLSTTRNCAGGSVCEFPIAAGFSESFKAVPKPGYQFVRWQKGTGLNCGDSTNPTCTVALTGNAALDAAAIATFDIVHIMPIYKDVGFDSDSDGLRNELDKDDDNDGILDVDDTCPLNSNPNCVIESLIVNGREWAQPDLFRGVTWDEINAICPEGVCTGALTVRYGCRGVPYPECDLPSSTFNLTGWTWAGDADFQDLATYYRGGSPEFDCPAYDEFLADGWREWTQSNDTPGVYGYTRDGDDRANSGYTLVSSFEVGPRCHLSHGHSGEWDLAGAWFFR